MRLKTNGRVSLGRRSSSPKVAALPYVDRSRSSNRVAGPEFALSQAGARIALTYQGDRLKERVKSLADTLDGSLTLPCDAADDEQKRDAAETRNQADTLAYGAEKMLSDNADKISDDKKKPVESAIESLKEAIKSDDTEAMKSSMELLNAALQPISADLYAQASAEGQQQAGGEAPGGDAGAASDESPSGDDVIDADFEMVDEEKK